MCFKDNDDEEIDKMERQISLQEICEKRKTDILKLASAAAANEGDKFRGQGVVGTVAGVGSNAISVPLPSTPLKKWIWRKYLIVGKSSIPSCFYIVLFQTLGMLLGLLNLGSMDPQFPPSVKVI